MVLTLSRVCCLCFILSTKLWDYFNWWLFSFFLINMFIGPRVFGCFICHIKWMLYCFPVNVAPNAKCHHCIPMPKAYYMHSRTRASMLLLPQDHQLLILLTLFLINWQLNPCLLQRWASRNLCCFLLTNWCYNFVVPSSYHPYHCLRQLLNQIRLFLDNYKIAIEPKCIWFGNF